MMEYGAYEYSGLIHDYETSLSRRRKTRALVQISGLEVGAVAVIVIIECF